MTSHNADSTVRILILLALAATLLVYLPAMTGGFAFDDYPNILNNTNLHLSVLSIEGLLEAGWSGLAGPLKRPIAMMSFALNFGTTGEFVGAFKFTNLVIHLVNGVLVFWLVVLIFSQHNKQIHTNQVNVTFLALVVAAIWLLHPLNVTSVVYVVQRMNSLSALFSLAAMSVYCVGRKSLLNGERNGWMLIIIGVPVLVLLGLLSKENAILVVPLIAWIELCIFRFEVAKREDRTRLVALIVGFVIVPGVASLIFLITQPEFLADRYVGRAFNLQERLLTEARVLWFYVGLIVLPRLREFGLYHDDFVVSTSIAAPLSTTFAVLGIAFAVLVCAISARRNPILSFGVGWFLIAHVLESSIIPLELVHEHRNYVPMIGPLAAIVYCLNIAFRGEEKRSLRLAVAGLALTICAGLTWLRAGDWSDPVTLAVVEAERHPNSYRAVYDLGRIQFGLYKARGYPTDLENAIKNLRRSAMIDADSKRPLAALVKLEYSRNREPNPELLAELARRYRETNFHASETLDLHQMVKCRAAKACNIPKEEILKFYQAALGNETLPNYSKGQLLVDLAVLLVNEASDYEAAIEFLNEAVALIPDEFGFRKVQTQVYISAGRFDDAQKQIRDLRKRPRWRDRLNYPESEIKQLVKQMDDRQNGFYSDQTEQRN